MSNDMTLREVRRMRLLTLRAYLMHLQQQCTCTCAACCCEIMDNLVVALDKRTLEDIRLQQWQQFDREGEGV